MAYTEAVYRFSEQVPDGERYNLVSQIRKAAVSVPLNIAEGAGCATGRDFARFLGYAYRSVKEVATCLELCQRLYPAVPSPSEHLATADELARMIFVLIQRLDQSGPTDD